MARPRLLDLFCCAGGAARGYHDAGFDVVGVDVEPQPNYPYEFHQADALTFPVDGFEVVHASPPCQTRTAYRRRGGGVGDGYADLIVDVQKKFRACGLPYVIENVATAPLQWPITLCGSMFGLDVRRHRLFESSTQLTVPPCNHAAQPPGRFPGATNRATMSRATVEVGVWRIPLDVQKLAMGIDWDVTLRELSEAVPPAYTKFIGKQLLESLHG